MSQCNVHLVPFDVRVKSNCCVWVACLPPTSVVHMQKSGNHSPALEDPDALSGAPQGGQQQQSQEFPDGDNRYIMRLTVATCCLQSMQMGS